MARLPTAFLRGFGLALCAFVGISAGAEGPGLGRSIAERETPLDLVVFTDGAGLPPGGGGVSQGRKVYEQACRACHGPEGRDGINDRLTGGELPGVKSIGSYWPYATSIFDYVRRAMPYAAPGSLTDDDVYAVVAYLLYLNGIVAEDVRLDAQALARIQLPNRQAFFSEYPLP